MQKAATYLIAIALGSTMLSAQAGKPDIEKITNGPVLEGTGDTWATVAWTTNTGGSTVVHYGTDPNHLDQTAQAPYSDVESTQAQNHRVRLTNLQPGKTYYYRVTSAQGEGTGTAANAPVQQFTTKGESQAGGEKAQRLQITKGPVVEKAAADSAVIAWSTNTGGSSIVRYGTDRNNLSQMAESPYEKETGAPGETHRVVLKNLQPNTTYYYQIDSGQGQGTGTEAKSSVESFKTAPK
jgi:phosphodiesterase/alkaline phosphatase D-like protein